MRKKIVSQLNRKCMWLWPALIPLLSGPAQAQAIKNVLQPSDPIIASSLNSPSTEGVANAIDGTQAKYLNFDGATGPTGFVVTPQVGSTLISGLGMETANDSGPGSNDRDPSIVTIEGSNDPGAGYGSNTTWTLIYSNSVPLITNRYQFVYFYFSNYQAFTSYRWTAVKAAGPGQNSMQIAEVQLLGTAVPLNVLQPSDPIVASSLNSPSTEGVANAIDGTQAKYLNFDGATGPTGFVVTPQVGATVAEGLAMETANDSGPGSNDRDPAIVTLEGSNDTGAGYNTNTTWTLIYSNSVPLITNRYQFIYFYFPNQTPYTSYRWTAVKAAGPGQNSMQIAEVQVLGVSAPVNVLQPSDPIVASSLNSPSTEGVANAIDGTQAKYLNFDGATGPTGFVVTPQSGATTITGLGMETANDSGPGSNDRDPAIVTVEGSNDAGAGYNSNTTWTLIYSNNVPLITNRYQFIYFYFPNNISYTSYRWTAVKAAGPGQNSMQIAEVQLLAVTTKADCTKAAFVSQPVDTPVLAGAQAQLFTTVNGPWPLQWATNGVPVPGATKTTFTTDPITSANAGIAYSVAILGCQTSAPVHAVIFTPSATESIGIQFGGGGANGAPVYMDTNDIAGVQQQAFWNTATNGGGSTGDAVSLPDALVDSSNNTSAITFTFQTSGTWGAGVGTDTATERLLNGTTGAGGPGTAQIYTFGNVPPGNHAILVYAVCPPTHRDTASYAITNPPAQTTYMRVMASEEYKAAPGFYRSTSTSSTSPEVGDFVRFDGVSPDVNSNITLVVNLLDTPPDGHNQGVNAIQLVLDAPNPGAPPTVTQDLQPTVGPAGGSVTLSVTATGTGLTYQWRKNGIPIQNGGGISGATTSTLTINPLNAGNEGVYSVAIFSPAGSTVSANASVRISNYNIQDALAGYWKFDETGNVTNALNSATNGTADDAEIFTFASPPGWAAGKVGGAYTFDQNTWGFVTNFNKASSGIAASAWVNLGGTPPGSSMAIIQNAEPNLNVNASAARGSFEMTLVFDATSGNMYPEAGVGVGANIYTVTGTTPVPASGWHHVAFTADGAQVRVYVDGNLAGTVGYSGEIASPSMDWLSIGARLNSDTNSLVGVSPDSNPEFFGGSIDELALWDRALSSDEITALYTAGNGGKALTTIVETAPATGGGTLKASVSGGQITVTWTSGTLQSAASVAGPWTDVQGATGGTLTEAVAPGAKFYRTH